MIGKGFDHGGLFILSQQAVVYQNTGKLIADCFVKQGGHHGAIDSSREAADDTSVSDLFANRGDGFIGEVPQFPGAGQSTDIEQEVFQDLSTFG